MTRYIANTGLGYGFLPSHCSQRLLINFTVANDFGITKTTVGRVIGLKYSIHLAMIL